MVHMSGYTVTHTTMICPEANINHASGLPRLGRSWLWLIALTLLLRIRVTLSSRTRNGEEISTPQACNRINDIFNHRCHDHVTSSARMDAIEGQLWDVMFPIWSQQCGVIVNHRDSL
jgi:hypothetical protein